MKAIRRLALPCVLLLLLYGVSPYFSFWRFTVALRSGNRAAISSRVDFRAIRTSLGKLRFRSLLTLQFAQDKFLEKAVEVDLKQTQVPARSDR